MPPAIVNHEIFRHCLGTRDLSLSESSFQLAAVTW